MSHTPARQKTSILREVCNLIPRHLVPRLARKHGVDRQARKFSPWSHVVALLHTHLTHALSLNDVCDGLRHHASKLLAIRWAKAPSRNGLSHANRERSAAMAEELFWETLDCLCRANPRFGGRTYRKYPSRFRRVIQAVDSTTIQLVARCVDWARHRRRKAAAKLHLSLDLQSFLPRMAIIDTAREHDNKRARELCAPLESGEIVVFDKAYVDFEHLWDLETRGVFWVSRAKDNLQYRRVRRRLRKAEGNILRDEIIVLTGPQTRAAYPEPLRLVEARVEVDGEWRVMVFLTNNLDWAPSSVVELYGCRWSIETFFKEIKQTLQLCDFLGHNKNAILWQIWTALLLYVLLRFLGFCNDWRHGFKRLFCLLRAVVWDNFNVAELLKCCGTAGAAGRQRAQAEQAYFPGFSPAELR